MRRPLKPHEHLLLLALFGGLLVYFLYGAIVGDLFVPGRRGPGIHLSGTAAWLMVLGSLLLYVAVLVRHGLLAGLSSRPRTAVEFSLLLGGVASLLMGIRLGIEQSCC